MKLVEFQHLLDAHGAHLSAWPDELRAAAEHLVATEPAAQTCLQEALRIDRLIVRGISTKAKPADASAARVLAALGRELPPQRRSVLSWPAALLAFDFAPARLRIAALGAVACLGMMLGLFGPDIAGDARFAVALASPETNLAVMFEPEPLTGVTP